MSSNKFKFIFAVLTYRNTSDVVDLLESLQKTVQDYKVVIVNNFYDEATESQIRSVAEAYNCDFIHSENLGYSVGNHKAIHFAQHHYEFDYLIVSNPDIIVQTFPAELFDDVPYGVIAPQIRARRGRNQNPMVAYNNRFANRMLYEGIRDANHIKFDIGRGINKLLSATSTIANKMSHKAFQRIYQAHGSFIIIPKAVLDEIGDPFDDNLFLFAEEGVLAWKLKQKSIPTYYCDRILVRHKEDGSMKFRNDINDQLKTANIYFYEKYYFA